MKKWRIIFQRGEEGFMVKSNQYSIIGMIILFFAIGFNQNGWADVQYTVKPGDTLYRISKAFHVSLKELINTNALKDTKLKPNQIITIPSQNLDESENISQRSLNRADKVIPTKNANRPINRMNTYVVKRGDTLSLISKKVGLSMDEIKEMNHLPSSHLKVGQILFLPKDENQWVQEEYEEFKDEDESILDLQRTGEKGEDTPSAPLGKWKSLEERSLFIRVVKTFLGVPYKLGGSTLRGIDCSAFVKKIYEIFNIQLPRTTREQFWIGKKVDKDQLEEGDLVFFRRGKNGAHVGIYIGDNQFVHASYHRREVKIDSLNTPYYTKRFLKGVRIKELERES